MIVQGDSENRVVYLMRVLKFFMEQTPAGENTVDYDETTCDGICLANDIAAELNINLDDFSQAYFKAIGEQMSKLFNAMDGANGEVRIMATRYEGRNWYCLLTIVEQSDHFWENWEELVGGDNDFFEASKYFQKKKEEFDDFVLVIGDSPTAALELAINEAEGLL